MGPLVDDAIGRRMDQALETAARDGRIATGGRVEDRPGNYYRPTVVTDLPLGHPLTREELFAPLVTVTAVDGLDAALAEANAVDYGLSAGIFTGDEQEKERFLDEIEAGVVYVNRRSGATTGAWPGSAVLLRLEGQRFLREGRPGPVVPAGLHARAEPHGRWGDRGVTACRRRAGRIRRRAT